VSGEALSWARLRTGAELAVVDIADHGALVESRTRLLPGTHVDLHLLTIAGRVLQRARVARAFVVRVDASVLSYAVALAFDAPVDTSPPRVVASRSGMRAGAVSTHERDHAPSTSVRIRPTTDSRPQQVAPVLETGPGSTM
jgi:hypothetical protein